MAEEKISETELIEPKLQSNSEVNTSESGIAESRSPEVCFLISHGKNHIITVYVGYVESRYKVRVFDHLNYFHSYTREMTLKDTKYTFYTEDLKRVADFLMCCAALKNKDTQTVSIHGNLRLGDLESLMVDVEMYDLVYQQDKYHIRAEVKRMLKLIKGIQVAEYKE